MAIAAGLGATMGVGVEQTVGTAVTPNTFITFSKNSLKRKNNTIQDQALHGGLYNLASRRVLASVTAAGGQELGVYDRGLGKFFRQMLGGSPVITSVGSGVSQHVYQPADPTGKSLTMQVGKPNTSGVIVPFTWRGVKITDWTLDIKTSGFASLAFTLDAWDEQITVAYTAPSYVASNLFSFKQAALTLGGTVTTAAGTTGTVTLSATLSTGAPITTLPVSATTSFIGVGTVITLSQSSNTQSFTVTADAAAGATSLTVASQTPNFAYTAAASATYPVPGTATVAGGLAASAVTEVQIKGKATLATDRIFLGSGGVKAEQISNGFWDITGQVMAEFANTTDILSTFYTDGGTPLQLTFTGPIVGGAVNSGLQVTVPQVRWNDAPPTVDGPQVLKINAPFTALDDGTNPVVQFLYTTLDATP